VPRRPSPVAVSSIPDYLQRCAQLLGVDLATIQKTAANVEPYICADGARIWSLMQLERQLRPEIYGRGEAASSTADERGSSAVSRTSARLG
jgi:hypothetical protein